MSSYHDSFGRRPETYDDDPDGLEADRREEQDERAAHPVRYCGHFCHDRDSALNPWVKACPVCGCQNSDYDPEAVSDIIDDELDLTIADVTDSQQQHLANLREINRLLGVK